MVYSLISGHFYGILGRILMSNFTQVSHYPTVKRACARALGYGSRWIGACMAFPPACQNSPSWSDPQRTRWLYLAVAAMVERARPAGVVNPCEADGSRWSPWAYYETEFGEANAELDLEWIQMVEWSWTSAEIEERLIKWELHRHRAQTILRRNTEVTDPEPMNMLEALLGNVDDDCLEICPLYNMGEGSNS